MEQRPKLQDVEGATAPLLLYDIIDDRHRAFSGLLVRGIEAMSVKAGVIYREHQNRPACERETIQQSRITAPKFFSYVPKPDQDLFRGRFSRRFEKIDMLQSVIAPGTQDDAVCVMQITELPTEDIGASRSVHGAFDDPMVRQQRLKLLRNVGLAWTHVRAVIDDRIAQKDDNFLCLHWMASRSKREPVRSLPFRTTLPRVPRAHTASQSGSKADASAISKTLKNRSVVFGESFVRSTSGRRSKIPPWTEVKTLSDP
jgi:hypothetical protein